MSEQKFAVKVTFPEPRHGYWDGGKKGGGTFEPRIQRYSIPCGEPFDHNIHPGPRSTIKWGCYRLNFWFTCGSGRTWREAASIAKRKLMHMCSVPDTAVEIIKLERIDKASLVSCAR